jgi:periplasmic copper chaperone A
MRRMRPASSTYSLAALAACGALLAPATAQAHISLHPNTIPAGAFATLDVRVPGEEKGAYAYKVDMLLPPGFTEVDTQNVPGWSVSEVMRKLAKPLQTDDGPIDEEVAQIIWTGDRSTLGRLEDGRFVQFPLSVAMPSADAGRSLAFKTLQYYSDGKVIRWIGTPDATYPAPTINVTAKGGVIEDVAGAEAGPAAGRTPGGASAADAPTAIRSGDAGGQGLAIAALALGALGLLVAGGALVVSHRAGSMRT